MLSLIKSFILAPEASLSMLGGATACGAGIPGFDSYDIQISSQAQGGRMELDMIKACSNISESRVKMES